MAKKLFVGGLSYETTEATGKNFLVDNCAMFFMNNYLFFRPLFF